MRVIHPFGQSEIDKEQAKRAIIASESKENEAQDLHAFFDKNIKFQISLWISTIDKVFNKPEAKSITQKTKKDFSPLKNKEVFKQRQLLGDACWEKFTDHYHLTDAQKEKFKPLWDAKIHPYIPKLKDLNQYFISDKYMNSFHGRLHAKIAKKYNNIKTIANEVQQYITTNEVGRYDQLMNTIKHSVGTKFKEKRKATINQISLDNRGELSGWFDYTFDNDIIAKIYDLFTLHE